MTMASTTQRMMPIARFNVVINRCILHYFSNFSSVTQNVFLVDYIKTAPARVLA